MAERYLPAMHNYDAACHGPVDEYLHFTRWRTVLIISTMVLSTFVAFTLGLVPFIHLHVETLLALSTSEFKVAMRTRESSAVFTVLAQLLVVGILSLGHFEAASHH